MKRRGWIRYLYEAPLTLGFVTGLSFLLMRLSPVSPAEAYARSNTPYPTAENIAKVTKEMGLDQPLIVQYVKWLLQALQLDFGSSLVNGKDAWSEFVALVPATFQIVALSVVIQLAGIMAVGVLTYLVWGSGRGLLLHTCTIVCLSIPVFYYASVYLELFAVRWSLISVSGGSGWSVYLHPAICLSIPSIAFYGRLLGSILVREMSEDYAEYARCKGLSETRIVWRHAVPRGWIALVPSFLQNIGFTIAGAAIIERVFSIPGIGYGIIDSVLSRDAPMIHLFVLFLGVVFVSINILAEACSYVLGSRRTVKEAA